MKTQIQLNGKEGLMNMDTGEVCSLPERWRLLETVHNGIEDVIDMSTGDLAILKWRPVEAADKIIAQHRCSSR